MLAGAVLAGSTNGVWNAARPASRGFPGARASRSLAMAQRQRPATRSRLTRAEWLEAMKKRGSASHQTGGSRFDGQFMVDTAIHHGPASTQQCVPSVAFDGNNYLVAWTEYQDTLSWGVGVLGTRVTPDGTVTDPEGIQIDTMGLDPAVGFDGTNYLVVDWGAAIQGFRVSPAGRVLDSSAIVISSGQPGSSWHQVLAFDGTNYLVVWEEIRDSLSQIYGARVTPGGAVLDTAEIAVGTGSHSLVCPAVTFDGTNFLVVWAQACDSATSVICGTRVSPTGQVLDSVFVIDTASGPNNWCGPTTSSDRTNSLVVWQDLTLGLRGALVASDGSVVDTGIALAPASNYQGQTSLYDGTDFLVAWANTSVNCVMASRVSRAGVPLDTPGVYVSAPHPGWTERPACAFDGSRYFMVWDDFRSLCTNVYGARLTQQMNMLDTNGIGISRSTNTQYGSSVAYDGSNYLVAWTDNRNQAEAIIAARVSPGGANLDPAGIPICTLGFHREYCSVAFDGTNYIVTWADGRRNDSADIYAARVTKGGSVLDPQGFPVAVGGDAHILPAIACNGSNYLLIWVDLADSGMDIIRGARVSPAGRVLDSAGITICSALSAYSPVVTSNGANWLVAWHDWRSGSYAGVYAARITAAGQLLDSGGFALGAGDLDQGCATLASDGTDFLAVWERRVGAMMDVRGARISGDGALLDSFMVQPAVDSFGTARTTALSGSIPPGAQPGESPEPR